MYQKIKQKTRNRIILWSAIPAVMGILTLIFGFVRSNLADLPFKFTAFMLIVSGMFFSAMLIYIAVNLLRIRKIRSALSVSTDMDMEETLSRSEAIGMEKPPMAFLVRDQVVNFNTLKIYRLDSVRDLRRKVYTSSDSPSDDPTYSIQVKLTAAPFKDDLYYKSKAKRDAAFELLCAACAGYTDTSGFK